TQNRGIDFRIARRMAARRCLPAENLRPTASCRFFFQLRAPRCLYNPALSRRHGLHGLTDPGRFMDSINSRIANELGVRPQQVAAAVALLDEGSTVPFIARYRKEVTGSLDDTQLRNLEERL